MLDVFGGRAKWRLGRNRRAKIVYSCGRVMTCSVMFQWLACFSSAFGELSMTVRCFANFYYFLPESCALLRFDAITLFSSRILCASGSLAGQI